jgi:Helix-turn-helix domain
MRKVAAFSITEAIEFSGIGRTKIYSEIASGALVARKAGRKTLILADDLETFLGNLPILNTGKRRSAQAA